MLSKRVSTIGYEGKTVDEVLDRLSAAGVELVIDVRAVASSRRPGFSKSALAGALAERGIDYLQLRELGTPAAGRAAARQGRTAEMRRIYSAHLSQPESEVAFPKLVGAASTRHAALLCYEADPAQIGRAHV